MTEFTVRTSQHAQFVEITGEVQRVVTEAGIATFHAERGVHFHDRGVRGIRPGDRRRLPVVRGLHAGVDVGGPARPSGKGGAGAAAAQQQIDVRRRFGGCRSGRHVHGRDTRRRDGAGAARPSSWIWSLSLWLA